MVSVYARAKIARAKRPKRQGAAKKAHLDDMPFIPRKGHDFTDIWAETQRARQEIQGGDDSAGKARVTFAIPSDVWFGTGI